MYLYLKDLFWIFFAFYLPIEVCAQKKSIIISKYIQLPDVYSNRSTNDIIQDQKGAIWIANNSGLFFYDGVKCQAFVNNNIHPAQIGEVYYLAEDDQQCLWLKTEHGLFILSRNRSHWLSPKSMGIPDSIFKATNLNFCRGPSNTILFLAGNSIYHYANGSLHIWANYHTAPYNHKWKAVMAYEKKEEMIYFYALGYPFLGFKRNGNFSIYKNVMDIEDNPLTLNLTNAFADSVSIYHNLNLDYVTQFYINQRTDTLIKSSTKILIHGFSLPDIRSYFIDTYRPDLNPKNIGWDMIFRISSDVFALTSTEGLLLLKFRHPKVNYFKESIGQRIRAIQEDAFGHLIFGTHEGTKYLHKKYGHLQQLSDNHLCAWSILPIRSQMDQFIISGEGLNNNILNFVHSTPQEVRIVKHNIGDTPPNLSIPV